ncbi:MAG: right-handed parallel beta-helix repeat-containing protein [Nanoarchaeota archaeon]|nr:right-handed parallel beta-helix repeat-containing protein [Nanoarchaeota archaeon]
MKKLILVFALLIAINTAYAANCGGATRCFCGDTLTEDQVMWYDLENCVGNGLVIGNPSITLNCNTHFLRGNNAGQGIQSFKDDISIENCRIENFSNGLNLRGDNNNVVDNILENNEKGIIYKNSIDTNFEGNKFYQNNIGAYGDNSWLNEWGWDDTDMTGWQNGSGNVHPIECGPGVCIEGSLYAIEDSSPYIETTSFFLNDTFDDIMNVSFWAKGEHNSNIIALTSDGGSLAIYLQFFEFDGNQWKTGIPNRAIVCYNGLNNWKKMTLEVNIEANTFNAYCNDILMTTNQPFSNSMNEISQIRLSGAGGTLKFDNLTVIEKQETIPNYWFDNQFTNNEVSAYEELYSSSSQWHNNEAGNYWSDFESNPGYPEYYEIPGPGNGIDIFPIEEPPNEPPSLIPIGPQTFLEGFFIILDIHATDPNNDTLTYDFDTNLPCPCEFNNEEGILGCHPDYNDAGTYWGSFTVTDGEFFDEENITITINNTPYCGDTITEDTFLIRDILDCPNEGLIIGADDITLNCDGHVIDGTGNTEGIYIYQRQGVHITNCDVKDFSNGIMSFDASFNEFSHNDLFNNHNGMNLADTLNTSIHHNYLANNQESGLILHFSNAYNQVYDNKIFGNGEYGIVLVDTGALPNMFWNNNFTNNLFNAYEDTGVSNNNWNFGEIGNYWGDFPDNPGFPEYYYIPGPGDGIDYHPIWDFNEPPELQPIGPQFAVEGQQLIIDADAFDPDNDTLNYYFTSDITSPYEFNPDEGILNWVPTYYDAGTYTATFNVTDGEFWDGETITIEIENTPYVDLEITSNDILFSDDQPVKNNSVTITAFFRNLLEDDPEEVTVRYYNGPPEQENVIGEDIVQIRRSTFVSQIEWTPEVEGDYDIYVWIDPDNAILEASEDNNIAYKTINVQTKPDLRLRNEDIFFSDNNPDHGDDIQIMAMVRNIEALPSGPFMVRFYDGDWQNMIAEVPLTLNPFQTEIATANWTAVAGNHDIFAYADSNFDIDELREYNNRGTKQIYVDRAPWHSSSPVFRKLASMEQG